jgi:hypothetical protein
MRFTILELPAVCQVAREYIDRFGLHSRIETHAADMFRDPWPGGHDAIFFSNIFHDWDRERCLELARRSFAALPPGGRIYAHEALLSDAGDGPLTVALFSMHMLIRTEGKQLSASELRALLEQAGFTRVSVTPTCGYYSLVTGTRPETEE